MPRLLLPIARLTWNGAREFGRSDKHITAVLPGAGGIDFSRDTSSRSDTELRTEFGIPEGVPLVLNPRGARPYVRNDVFLKAVGLVHKAAPSIVFLGVGLRGWAPAEHFIAANGLQKTLLLTSYMDRTILLALMRIADVSVSAAEHDGTPNTLLEAMYAGSFPVCGELPSIREWISPGKNGLLIDPSDAQQLAHSILKAVGDKSLRTEAAAINRQLVKARADRSVTRENAESLYQKLAGDFREREKRNVAGSTQR
jgi:glycosyltransferase involved in cell wall biosynthesis